MFQSYALLPHMTVFENVRFPLRMQNRLDRAGQAARVREALELVQLGALGDRYPRQLSGGQQQRAALARSIVAEPDVLLLDEPLSNLDARLREGMQVELKRLHEQLGLTTVFVTHDQTEALALAGNVVLMNEGAIEQRGTPEEIYHRPRTAFAADFIGGANVLAIDVFRGEAGWQGRLPDGTAVPLAHGAGMADGKRRFMLRKEAISLDPHGAMVAIAGIVETRNFLGGQTRSVIRAGGLRLVAVSDSRSVAGSAGRGPGRMGSVGLPASRRIEGRVPSVRGWNGSGRVARLGAPHFVMVHDLPAMQESAQGRAVIVPSWSGGYAQAGGARAGSAQAGRRPSRKRPGGRRPSRKRPGRRRSGGGVCAACGAEAVFAVSFHHRHHPATNRLRMACRTG